MIADGRIPYLSVLQCEGECVFKRMLHKILRPAGLVPCTLQEDRLGIFLVPKGYLIPRLTPGGSPKRLTQRARSWMLAVGRKPSGRCAKSMSSGCHRTACAVPLVRDERKAPQ